MRLLARCVVSVVVFGAGAAAGQTDEGQSEARAMVWQVIRRASQHEFRGSLLIHHDPSEQTPHDDGPVSYTLVTVDSWGLTRVDRFQGLEEPSPDAAPARTDVVNPHGYWTMDTRQGRRLCFVRSHEPRRWGYFGEGPENIEAATRQVSRHVYQRAGELERWVLFDAALEGDELKGAFYGDTSNHLVLFHVTWTRHDGAWLVREISTHPKAGCGAIVCTNYQDYRQVGSAWIAHQVQVDVTRRKTSSEDQYKLVPYTDTVVRVGGPVSPGAFRPPFAGQSGLGAVLRHPGVDS